MTALVGLVMVQKNDSITLSKNIFGNIDEIRILLC